MRSIRFLRRFPDNSTFRLGNAVEYPAGWKFIPNVFGRKVSTKYHRTWEQCLPRWLGYPDRCESREVTNEDHL